jgi:hypothetical protein
MLALANTPMKSNTRMATPKSRMSCDSISHCNGCILESLKHWSRRTQECYKCHKQGDIPRYRASTAAVECAALNESAAAAAPATTTISIEYYLMTVTGISHENQGCHLDSASTSDIGGDLLILECISKKLFRPAGMAPSEWQ